MPFNDTTHNPLFGFLRKKRLILDPFFILFGVAFCVLSALYLENMYAKVGVSLLAAGWTIGALVMCCVDSQKPKEEDEENIMRDELLRRSRSTVSSVSSSRTSSRYSSRSSLKTTSSRTSSRASSRASTPRSTHRQFGPCACDLTMYTIKESPSIMTESPSRIARPTKKYSTESEELSCPSDKDDDDPKSDAEILK